MKNILVHLYKLLQTYYIYIPYTYKNPIRTASKSLDNIRSASETFNNNTPGRTMHQREKFSLMMGHALTTGMGYSGI